MERLLYLLIIKEMLYLLIYRAGHFSDETLEKGYWWSDSLDQVKPYFRGKIIIAEIEFDEKMEKKYILTKEIIKYGHHDGYGKWFRTLNDNGEEENYYYISPSYLKNLKIIKIYTGEEALDFLEKNIKKEDYDD